MSTVRIYFYSDASVIVLYIKEGKEYEMLLDYKYFLSLNLIQYVKKLHDIDENCKYKMEFLLHRVLYLNEHYMQRNANLMDKVEIF